jgi:hypothetical protein
MNLKQKKFQSVQELYQTINSNQKSICVFVHISNLNVIESNQIKIFCEKNNVQTQYIKINLLKKLTKNSLFLNLLTGPTKLFFFSDISIFLNFFENFPLKRKIFPLAVFFNNQFFSYLFFFTYLKNSNLSYQNLKITQENFITNSTQTHKDFVVDFNVIFLNFIWSLSFLKNTTKII